MKNIFFILISAFIFFSCEKSTPPVPFTLLRIQNNTGFTIDSVRHSYTDYNFGTIEPGSLTQYISFDTVVNDAGAIFVLDSQQRFAGRIFPPDIFPVPVLEPGKYTLQIFTDSTSFLIYDAELIKD
jgi:hypothetical protein